MAADPYKAAAARHIASLKRGQKKKDEPSRETNAAKVRPTPRFKFVVAMEGLNLVRLIHSPNFRYLPNGFVGVKIKKRVFPAVSAPPYLVVDLTRNSVLARECIDCSSGTVNFETTAEPERFRAVIESGMFPDIADRRFFEKHLKHSNNVPSDPSSSINELIENLPSRTIQQLYGIWRNALRAQTGGKKLAWSPSQIMKLVEAIETEWSRRKFEVLSDEAFAWPTTEISKTKTKGITFDNQSEGMLSYLEYRVGRSSNLSTASRRAILERVFRGKLPPVFPEKYMNEWGNPSSACRLKKTAESIAAFARNCKRRDDDRMDQAIREWEADLEWLHDEFYVGVFGFSWPSTRVGADA